jgi:hypothetical protein
MRTAALRGPRYQRLKYPAPPQGFEVALSATCDAMTYRWLSNTQVYNSRQQIGSTVFGQYLSAR